MYEGDTLSLVMRQFDLSNLDILFKSKGFDIDGFISCDALVSSLKENPMVLANLDAKSLAVNGDKIGDAVIESLWDNENKAVNLNANILNELKTTLNM